MLRLTATGPLYELLLLAAPGQRYHLLYDNKLVSRPQHNLQPLKRTIRIDTPAVTAQLLPVIERQTQPKTVASEAWASPLASPWLLGMLVAISAALLTASLYRSVTRLDSVFPDPTATDSTTPNNSTTRQ